MNTAITRANIILIYAMMAFICLTLCSNISFTNLLRQQHLSEVGSVYQLALLPFQNTTAPESELVPYHNMQNIKVLYYDLPTRYHRYSNIFMHNNYQFKQLIFGFDIDLDIRPLFSWGTKQVMVWILAEYNTTTPLRGSVEHLFDPRFVEPSLISQIPGIGLSEKEQQTIDKQIEFANDVSDAYTSGKQYTVKYTHNRQVIWDGIYPVENFFDGDFLLQNIESKYPIGEIGGKIDLSNINFYIQWEITPLLGFFSVKQERLLRSVSLVLP